MAWLIPQGVKNAFGYGSTQSMEEPSADMHLDQAELLRKDVEDRVEDLDVALHQSVSEVGGKSPQASSLLRSPSREDLSVQDDEESVYSLDEEREPVVATPLRAPSHLGEKSALQVLKVDVSNPTLKAALDKANETIGNDTTAWAETRKYANTTVGKFDNKVARFFMHGIMAVVAFLAYATFQGKSWATSENANRALLRNPTFTLPEHLQETQFAANRAVEALAQQAHVSQRTGTGFAHILGDQTANHASNPLSAQTTVMADALSNGKADQIQEALKPQLEAWKSALEDVGVNLTDEEYRALIAVATQNVVNQMQGLGNTAKNYMVDQAAELYGTTSIDRIAGTLAGRMTEAGLLNARDEDGHFTGVEAIHDDIKARAALIASVTGRDADEVETELYTALNRNQTFQNKLQRFENNAYTAINKARDLEALKASFIADRIATLRSLALFSVNSQVTKGTGEEYLKLLLNGDQLGGGQAAAHFGMLMGVQNLQERMVAMAQDKGKITGEFQKMFNFLDHLEDDFAAYVAEHEAKAQAQLERLVALDSLRGDGTYDSVEALVEKEGLELPQGEDKPAKIRTAIDASVAKADPVSDEKLREIFDILIGTGKGSELGAPTMAQRFVGTLAERGKLQFADEQAATTDALLGLTRQQLGALTQEDDSHLVLDLNPQGRIAMQQFGGYINDVRIARGLIQARQEAVEQAVALEEEVVANQ
ncbi:MAG: hypothetical protein AB7N99_03940 [Simkaniaceae bacterium]